MELVNRVFQMLLPAMVALYYRIVNKPVTFNTPDILREYDYIIVGGGSAGAVVANRLSEDPYARVLLIEAGGAESDLADIPLIAATLQKSDLDWQYRTVPQTASCFGLREQRSNWPRGKVLGGSSVLNYMLYVRGSPHDYNKWEREGAEGWAWKDVFPYFLKSEDNTDPDIPDNGYHSRGGYLTVSRSPYSTPLAEAFLEAGEHMGYQRADINGAQITGFMIPHATLRNGARCSTRKAFLDPVLNRTNLHFSLFSHATRIIIGKDKIAKAVQFDRFGVAHTVYAKKEIILSAGSINSAQLLMLSGIGPRSHLEHLGVSVVADLPVGSNLQDHIFPGGVNFLLDEPVSVLQSRIFTPSEVAKYFTKGEGALTLPGGVEGLGFVKTKYANQSMDWPDVEIHFASGSPASDGGETFKQAHGMTDTLWRTTFQPHIAKDSMALYPVLLRPKSKGYIRLASRDPYAHPIIDPKYLTHPQDILTMVESMKISIRLAHMPPFKKFGVRIWDTPIPGCERYPLMSDEQLACIARTYTSTLYHPVGTCKMGNVSDPTAVVDSKLRVIGIGNLRVVDASIMPSIVSGNTNAPVIMIAEKASDIIKNDR
ncbi:glucose dehydrogenase [FAD, quinone]-like isoform X2 [Ornithodoros turicata]|uniref:glucose dehydrogenase [FAD, quinone]-like isoform X2 n=1 Tax=Ornithodoros turicata TaxID=34597 RepID=UPI003139E8D2